MSVQSIEQPVNIKNGDTQPDLMYEQCMKYDYIITFFYLWWVNLFYYIILC